MYFDIRKELDGNSYDEDQLINSIKNLNWDKAVETSRKFSHKFVEEAGNASRNAVDIIWKYLNGYSY